MTIRRSAGIVAVAVFAAGCTGGPAATQTDSQSTGTPGPGTIQSQSFAAIPGIVRRLEPSVVTIFAGKSSGSGVVYKADGIIVTNAHVVGATDHLEVAFADGQRVSATLIAKDKLIDLAVIRVERKDLPVPKFATALPAPGELVLAMGTPLGFENSVTAGIVSGLGRDIPGSAGSTRSLIDLIQTDAAISPGNSGGALVNADGEVVGINEAYIPPQAGAVSLGFAIPATTVTDVAEQLLKSGEVIHPFVGIAPTRITPEIADALHLTTATGVLVRAVVPDGPAAAASVKVGDVITKLGDQEITTMEDFFAALRDVKPGDRVALQVRRGGDTVDLTLTAGTLPK